MNNSERQTFSALEAFRATHNVYGRIDNGNDKASSYYYFGAIKARNELRVAKFKYPRNGAGNRELDILRRLAKRPHIQQVVDADTSSAQAWFASEAVSTLSLRVYTDQYAPDELVPEQLLWHLFSQGASVLAYMHSGAPMGHLPKGPLPKDWSPISHNAFDGENFMLAPPIGGTTGYPDLLVTEFSKATRHKPGQDARFIPQCKYDVSNLSVAIHFAMHRRDYANKKNKDGCYCVCFKKNESRATELTPQSYSPELMGILNACADPNSAYQFTAVELAAHLTPLFTAKKLANPAPLPVGVGLALAEEVEGSGVSVVRALNGTPRVEDEKMAAAEAEAEHEGEAQSEEMANEEEASSSASDSYSEDEDDSDFEP